MKIAKWLIGVFIMVLATNTCTATDLHMVRELFHEIKSEEDIDQIIEWDSSELSEVDLEILKAYQGVCQSMKAQYHFSPISKLKSFKEGKNLIEESIENDKGVENTYLRLLLQMSVPKMLGYYENISEDLTYLEKHLPKHSLGVDSKETMVKTLVKANDGTVDLSKLVEHYLK